MEFESGPAPLILTAVLDPDSQAMFQRLRSRHFPAALDLVAAHLTLFHHLPGHELGRVVADVRRCCATTSSLRFEASRTRFLGRGVAIEVDCPALVHLRRGLADPWWPWLTAQDRQGFRPHVTVQNKVAPAEARSLRAELGATLAPRSGEVIGLALWHYRGGPWEAVGTYGFGSGPP